MPNCTTTGHQPTITWVKNPLRKDTVSIGPINVVEVKCYGAWPLFILREKQWEISVEKFNPAPKWIVANHI